MLQDEASAFHHSWTFSKRIDFGEGTWLPETTALHQTGISLLPVGRGGQRWRVSVSAPPRPPSARELSG